MKSAGTVARLALVLVAPALALGACGDNMPGVAVECNPLGGQGCMLPWPSMAYVTEDPTTATGFRLDVPVAAMPVNFDGIVVQPDEINRWDGFSAIGPIVVRFPEGVSEDGLPGHRDPARSVAADSPIVLIEVATGSRVPLFAEVDHNAPDPARAALIIRPLARLHPSSRYAIAIRKSVRAADGGELASPAAFVALRDGASYPHRRFPALAAGARAMFAALAKAGVPKTDLVVAWDFVTVSDEFVRSDLTAMRAQALPAIGDAGANLGFSATLQPRGPGEPRQYLGTFQSPDFLTAGETDISVLRRDASGLPLASGLRDATFAAVVPDCVNDVGMELPRPTIIFGHGLFGSAEGYLSDRFVSQLAEEHCFVILAGDFIGLNERQLALAPLAVNDLNRMTQISEKLAQSVIDFIALAAIARGPMARAPEFAVNGVPAIDPARIYYVGGSLGGIMGATILAYDPHLIRGVLAVPGGNWSMLLERSSAWELLILLHQSGYPDADVHQLNLAMALGMGLEPYDPLTTAAHLLSDPILGNPAKQILMWYAIGDSLVTNIATEMLAREMRIPLLGPSVKQPFDMGPAVGPLESAITVYDDHPTPLPYETNQPREDNGTHAGINRKAAAMRQVARFLLAPFEATTQCQLGGAPAPCDCATGACD